jgi:hypothetical protein
MLSCSLSERSAPSHTWPYWLVQVLGSSPQFALAVLQVVSVRTLLWVSWLILPTVTDAFAASSAASAVPGTATKLTTALAVAVVWRLLVVQLAGLENREKYSRTGVEDDNQLINEVSTDETTNLGLLRGG